MNKKTRYLAGGVVLIVAVVFGYYTISPLFRILRANDSQLADARSLASGEVVGTFGHPASGSVRLEEASGKTYVRYEDFNTINGPDLLVYLSKDLDAHDYVSLGRVRATNGNVNYEIPAGVNPADYRYVLTWCRTFSVLFNYADLSATSTTQK